MVVSESERAKLTSCTGSQLFPSRCHHRDRKLKDFLAITLEGKCLFLAGIWPLSSGVYKEFLTVCSAVWNLGQNMEQIYVVRMLSNFKKE